MHEYAKTQECWHNTALGQKWAAIRKVRSEITTALEAARNEGLIGGSLSADIRVTTSTATAGLLAGIDLADLCITSSAELIDAGDTPTKIEVARATGGKCARCWKQFSEIPVDSDNQLCGRCADVVAQQGAGVMFSLPSLVLGAAIYFADPFGAGAGSADQKLGIVSPVRDWPADSHYPVF